MIIKKDITLLSLFGFPDTDITQYSFEICAWSKNYFAVTQHICIHLIFFTLTLTAETRTQRTEISQLHR